MPCWSSHVTEKLQQYYGQTRSKDSLFCWETLTPISSPDISSALCTCETSRSRGASFAGRTITTLLTRRPRRTWGTQSDMSSSRGRWRTSTSRCSPSLHCCLYMNQTSASLRAMVTFGAKGATASWRTSVSDLSWYPFSTRKSRKSWIPLRAWKERRLIFSHFNWKDRKIEDHWNIIKYY